MAIVGTPTVVKLIGCDVEPPGPIAVTVRFVGPSGSGLVSAQAYVPEALAVVVHSVTGPGPVITMALPGVAVPEIVGVVVVRMFTGESTVSEGGPTTVKLLMAGAEVPPALLASAVMLAGPSTKVRLVQINVPDTLAVVMHDCPLGPSTVTLANGVAVPLTGGFKP